VILILSSQKDNNRSMIIQLNQKIIR